MAQQKALVTKKMEWLPIDHPQNKMYTDKLLSILDNRIKKDPLLFVLYRNGRIVWIGQSDKGIAKLRSQANANKRKRVWDRFTVYTLSNRAYLNDVEALATRIAMQDKIGYKNFAKAKNAADVVKKDVRKWTATEIKMVNKTLRPLENKYRRTISRIESTEKKTKQKFAKRIDMAKLERRRNMLRAQMKIRIDELRMQRKRLNPWKKHMADLEAKIRSFQSVKM